MDARQLRYAHPGFYGVLVAQTLATGLTGLGLLLGPSSFTASPSYKLLNALPGDQQLLGLLHVAPAVLLVYALRSGNLTALRFAAAGILAAFAWHALLILGTWPVYGPAAWVAPWALGGHAYIAWLATREPVHNPASSRRPPK